MLLCYIGRDTLVAVIAMNKVFATTSLTFLASFAVEVALCDIIFIQVTHLAEVSSKYTGTIYAIFGWLLLCEAKIASDNLNIELVKLMLNLVKALLSRRVLTKFKFVFSAEQIINRHQVLI